jgi:hypothetical protein
MSISVINGGGIVRKSSSLFRVLIVLAILFQGSLVAHNHATAPVTPAQALAQQ